MYWDLCEQLKEDVTNKLKVELYNFEAKLRCNRWTFAITDLNKLRMINWLLRSLYHLIWLCKIFYSASFIEKYFFEKWPSFHKSTIFVELKP